MDLSVFVLTNTIQL